MMKLSLFTKAPKKASKAAMADVLKKFDNLVDEVKDAAKETRYHCRVNGVVLDDLKPRKTH